MIDHTPANRYREMDVAAMSPAQRVVALTGRLHLALRQAKLAVEQGDVERRESRLDLASAILHELAGALDLEKGGEIATRLAALYAWLIGECLAVHLHPDAARLDSPIAVVGELYGAWNEAARAPLQGDLAGAA